MTGCTECDGDLRMEDEETICTDCGLVCAEDRIDRGPEWRSTGEESEKRRTGSPLTRSRHDRGLSIEIGLGTGTEASGPRRKLARMRCQHNRARLGSKSERNKMYAHTEMGRLVSALSLPDSVRDRSCALFDSAQNWELLRGRSLEGFAAAAVYASCRTQCISRTMGEITDVSRAERTELKAAYDALNRELGLPGIEPTEYLPRYASELGLDRDVESLAREYAAVLSESGEIGGKNPSGVAAACLYKAASEEGVDLTQSTAGDFANVFRMTIRSTVEGLKRLV